MFHCTGLEGMITVDIDPSTEQQDPPFYVSFIPLSQSMSLWYSCNCFNEKPAAQVGFGGYS